MQENSSCFDGEDTRLNGPMLRKLLHIEERFLVSPGSSSWKELMRTAVALVKVLPILCGMVAKGESRSPKMTPLV
ncbi:hypothetical protein HanRHA438_Chr05g0210331 [Helianthus annuus]|nr:hypothetical protein HanRHA438_Chr05g0210331 [Helianthus annuus]